MAEPTTSEITARTAVNDALSSGDLYLAAPPGSIHKSWYIKTGAQASFKEAGIKFVSAPGTDAIVSRQSMADAIGAPMHTMDVVLGRVSTSLADDKKPYADRYPPRDQDFESALKADELLKGARDPRDRNV